MNVLRFPLLLIAMATLMMALLGGLARLPWRVEWADASWITLHGPLMVCGFLGTLIGVERAIGTRWGWSWIGPVASAVGIICLLWLPDAFPGMVLMALASLVMTGIMLKVWITSRQHHDLALLAGASSWTTGNLLIVAGKHWPEASVWWMGFLVLTIFGERLEMTRLTKPKPGRIRVFQLAMLLVLGGMGLPDRLGQLLVGTGFVVFMFWLFRHDLALRTIRMDGLQRFVAVCLLSGVCWLGVAGALLMFHDMPPAGFLYDMVLHMVFLGFVFAMIFGHAPIIFPAVMGVKMSFHPVMYTHLVILHCSLLLRCVGDGLGIVDARIAGGAGNGLAIALFLINTVVSVMLARRS